MTQAPEMTLHADVADSRIKEHRHLLFRRQAKPYIIR